MKRCPTKIAWTLTLLALPVLPAQEGGADASAYQQLLERFEAACSADGADRAEVVADFLPRFEAAAKEQGKTGAEVPFLRWIVDHGGVKESAVEAVTTLVERHALDPEFGAVAERIAYLTPALGDETALALLEQVLRANSHPEVQARTRLARARIVLGKVSRDVPSTLRDQAKEDLALVAKLTKDPDLVAAAAAVPTEERDRDVGSVAPDIAGADLDGVPFRLSDYLGKVVVLDFWGDW